jgi:hypothetical protein
LDELQYRVVLDEKVERPENAIVFGSVVPGETSKPFHFADEGALSRFYYDLILGRAMPLTLVLKKLENVSHVVAVTLFLHRDLALHPQMHSLVSAANLAVWGPAGLAHIDSDLATFFRFLEAYVVGPVLSRAERGRRLEQAVVWLRDYLQQGGLPGMRVSMANPWVLDRGTNGFVVAEQKETDLEAGWQALYREGHLRGVLFGPDKQVLIAKKSLHLSMNLETAHVILTTAEKPLGGWWRLEGPLLLWGETGLTQEAVLKILLRV